MSYYVVTSQTTNEKWNINNISFKKDEKNNPTIIVSDEETFQKIIGFGGAFTEASCFTLSKLPPLKRQEVITAYFNPDKGINYSLGRCHINSCDFSLENYTYVADNDDNLETFNISREHKWVIPVIKAASKERGEKIKILASPWSPPAWMKSNNCMNHGGKLLTKYYETWARYICKYIKEMKSAGINIKAVTIQNEPQAVQVWDSCIYSGEEERDFVKLLGPILVDEGLSDIKILIWDHNRDLIIDRAKAVLEDKEAFKYVWGIAFHWYVSEDFRNVGKVHELYPTKHLLFTEGCQEGGTHIGAWHTGERYARNIIGDMNNYCEGYIDWNLCLDETGGPNHVNNLCDAPIIINTINNEIIYNSSYYYIGHFSKYVLPNSYRIYSKSNDSRLQTIAFINPNNEVIVIVLNETNKNISYTVSIKGNTTELISYAHSIHTIVYQNNGDKFV